MTRAEYIADIKTRFGEQMSKDGMPIRDMDDDLLLEKMLTRYPGDRDEIDDLDETMTNDLPEYPKTELQRELETKKQSFLSKIKENFDKRVDTASDEILEDQNPIRKGLRVLGQGAGFVGDIASETISAITPDAIGERFQEVGESIAESPVMQKIGEKYGEFKEANPEFSKDIEDVVGLASIVPGVKTLTKGITKGIDEAPKVVERASEVLENRKLAQTTKDFNEVIDVVAPRISGKEGEKILGSSNVSVTEPTLFKGSKADFSKDPYTIKVARAVEDIVDPSRTNSYNLNKVKDAVSDVAENQVRPFLSENKVPFNFEDLRTRLTQVQPTGSLKSDKGAFDTYNRVREEIIDDVANYLRKSGDADNLTDMNELWDARKIIDSRIENELGTATFGTPQYTGVKVAALDMRKEINKFIIDSLSNPKQAETINKFYEFLNVAHSRGMRINSEADAVKLLRKQMGIQDIPEDVAKGAYFKYQLEQMSQMYEAISNLIPKTKADLGKSKLNLFIEKNPIKSKAVGYGVPAAGVTAGILGQ